MPKVSNRPLVTSQEEAHKAYEIQRQSVAATSMKAGSMNGVNGKPSVNGAAANGKAVKPEDIKIPFDPMVVVFRDLCYFVPMPGDPTKDLQLLKNIWGHFKPGVLTALMGASGAGKTTLMDV